MKKHFVLSVAWWLGCFLLLCFIMGFSIASADVIENVPLRIAVTAGIAAAMGVTCWLVTRFVLNRWGGADRRTILVLDAGEISNRLNLHVRVRGAGLFRLRLRVGVFLLRLAARVMNASLDIEVESSASVDPWEERDDEPSDPETVFPWSRPLFWCKDCCIPMSSCRCGGNARCPECGWGWSNSPCKCTGRLLEIKRSEKADREQGGLT